jgi:hypothetical protein
VRRLGFMRCGTEHEPGNANRPQLGINTPTPMDQSVAWIDLRKARLLVVARSMREAGAAQDCWFRALAIIQLAGR